MPDERNEIVQKVISLLQRNGFNVSPFLQANTCFDLVAKRDGTSIIIKIFDNVDSLREEQAAELEKLGAIFNSAVLVIGERTKKFSLQDSIIYNRYGISVINCRTFENFLSGKLPQISSFKGREIVELDSEKLKSAREMKKISLGEMARELNTTPESICRYEHGAKASLQAARKMEEFLNTDLIQKIDLFDTPETGTTGLFEGKPENDALEKMHSIGFKMEVFSHAPFKALSNPQDKLIISPEKTKIKIKRKAIILKQAKDIFGTHSVIITKDEFSRKSIGGSALVQEEELDSFSKFRELLELIKKRERE